MSTVSPFANDLDPLGDIYRWSGGYAMTLGRLRWRSGVELCCRDGHETPEQARAHGLTRLIEVAGDVADRYIAAWADDPT